MHSPSTALSVNLNKVALVRNTRHLGIPSVTRAATLCLEAGANGITVHPRPDARHIRASDVVELAQLLQDWPDREFNVEGNPFHNLMDCVSDLRARGLPVHQVTFVPDSEGQFTSDHGWSFPQDTQRLAPLVAQARALGLRVSLFMDAEPQAMEAAKSVGADRVELYTEPYAAAWGGAAQAVQLQRFAGRAGSSGGGPGRQRRPRLEPRQPGGLCAAGAKRAGSVYRSRADCRRAGAGLQRHHRRLPAVFGPLNRTQAGP
jgi:pyridoxine 5-phosphate synthase